MGDSSKTPARDRLEVFIKGHLAKHGRPPTVEQIRVFLGRKRAAEALGAVRDAADRFDQATVAAIIATHSGGRRGPLMLTKRTR